MIVVAYDGSADSIAAVDAVGAWQLRWPVTVLTVWESSADAVRSSDADYALDVDVAEIARIDQTAEQEAKQRGEEGAERARRAGLDATAVTRLQRVTVAQTILSEARRLDATAIIVGTRGRTGLKSALLGSVSHTLVQEADRTVVVVPSPEIAAKRAKHLH